MSGRAGGQVTRCVGREHFWYHQFFAHLLILKIMPAGAKVVKYEGDGDPEVPLADGQVVVVLTQTYRRVKTEDGRDFFVRKAFLKKLFPKGSAVNQTELTKKPKKDAATPMNKRTLRWGQRVLKNKRWWQRVRYHRKT